MTGGKTLFLNLTDQHPFRVVSATGRIALESRSGPVYDGWVRNASAANPELNIQEVHRGLAQLLGPSSVDELFHGKRILNSLPSVVFVDGSRVNVLDDDFNLLLCAQMWVSSAQRALREAAGGSLEAYQRFRDESSKRDGTPESEIDQDLLTIYRGMVDEAIAKARLHAETVGTRRDDDDKELHLAVTGPSVDRALRIFILILVALVPIVLVLSIIFKLG